MYEPLGKCPPAGQGVNEWVNKKVIRLLAQGVSEAAIYAVIKRETRDCGRCVKKDIKQSLKTGPTFLKESMGLASANVHNGNGNVARDGQWPELNERFRKEVIEAHDVLEASPTPLEAMTCGEVLQGLFDLGDLLCIGSRKNNATVRPLALWLDDPKLSQAQFIVPNLFKSGKVLPGFYLPKCNENVLMPRAYIVIDFDTGTINEQASLIRHLCDFGNLKMVVYSGGKSLHAWFDCAGWAEWDVRRFFRKACVVGADKQLWIVSQYCRLPLGTNSATAKPQSVVYLDLTSVKNEKGGN